MRLTGVSNNLLGVVHCSKQEKELTPTNGKVVVPHDPGLVLRAASLIYAKDFAGGNGRVILRIVESEEPLWALPSGENHPPSLHLDANRCLVYFPLMMGNA